jgi:hypothetical protein
MKICRKCKKEKDLTKFHKSKQNKDGYCSYCKKCHNVNMKKYYHKNREKFYKTTKKWEKENPIRLKVIKIKGWANYKWNKTYDDKYLYTLTQKECMDLLVKNCIYCNVPNAMGLDRVDSNKGYCVDNVVPCCSICNYMKLNLDVNDFKNHIIKIYNNIN